MLAACAARRWLARNAAGVKLIHSNSYSYSLKASECASLLSCLPALERVTLNLHMMMRDDLGCLLEALAWCPRLGALDLYVGMFETGQGDDERHWPFPYASAFAKLSSLTKLGLEFGQEELCSLAAVLGALAPLTGLLDLDLLLPQPAVVPAALELFKQLQSLALRNFTPCVLEAGCLDLPNLLSLQIRECNLGENAEELPGVAALQCLTCIELISGYQRPRFFDPRLVQLPGLKRLVLSCDICKKYGEWMLRYGYIIRLPDDMGLLSSSLLHLDFSGLRLAQFPLTLTQLRALECLDACDNEFAELPAGITALSRLKELKLGRVCCCDNCLQLKKKCLLNAVALGDLSGFPALCKLSFSFCEIKLWMSVLGGAVRHRSLASLSLHFAHPAPECMPMVLQLSQELKGVLKLTGGSGFYAWDECPALALTPFYKFKAALKCAL